MATRTEELDACTSTGSAASHEIRAVPALQRPRCRAKRASRSWPGTCVAVLSAQHVPRTRSPRFVPAAHRGRRGLARSRVQRFRLKLRSPRWWRRERCAGGSTAPDAADDGASDDGSTGSASGCTAAVIAANLAAARSAIKHVVIINQENRSFDTYFGTFPGADGIPMDGGVPPLRDDPKTGLCVKPYHDTLDENNGGPHSAASSRSAWPTAG